MWQIQRTPNPDLIRLNRGRSWELISELEYGEFLREIKDKKIMVNLLKAA